jgi:uncharacterized protein (TIGR02391 family)
MAKQTRTPLAAPHAHLTDAEKRTAIRRLSERAKELDELDITTIQSASDDRITALETRIEQTLSGIFGHESHEYKTLVSVAKLKPLFFGPLYFGDGNQPVGPSLGEVQSGVAERCRTAATKLLETARIMQEEIGPSPEIGSDRALRAYVEMDLHPAIDDAAGQLYRDGHFANAIEDAVKALNNLVRLKAGLDIDGAQLMTTAFSPEKPVLRFNEMADASDRDEQRGFMMMFAGAVTGLRNPRAHKLIKDDPERALEFIAFVSLLAKLLEGAKKPPRTT